LKKVDVTFLEFCAKSRNLRLGIATNSMNPYGNLSSKHSSWPLLLMISKLGESRNNLKALIDDLNCYGKKALMCLIHIVEKIFVCVQCCFAQKMISNHMVT